MSSQIELRATVCAQLADLLEGYFYETQSAYWGIMQKERTDPYEVFGFFPDTATAKSELGLLQEEFSELHEDFELSRIEDSFWQNAYKEFVTTWSDRRLHWIPLWERDSCKPPAGSAVVYLDAGMAFGTGAHETTRLCARRLIDYLDSSEEALESLHIIDAGCGSGVLAFSAAALGCSNIIGFDFDPEAIRVCSANAKENPHIKAPLFEVANLTDGLLDRNADLLLANIQTDVLIPHSEALVHAVRSGGCIALSGILTKEMDVVERCYAQQFAKLRPQDSLTLESRNDGEWSDLLIKLS
jgi:ribosomal protein L11 methyltransferase